MADKGSGGSRLPLALPPASQGCSSGGSGSSEGGSGTPRPPRSLQGLLQMAITAGSEEPDTPPEPMSEERRQWLQEAMSAAFRGQREEVEQMKSCLRVLSQPTPSTAGEAELASDQQEREGSLELLADLCENMDNAADFCQLSGMHLLVGRYLEAGSAGLRWRAAQLIGTCSQNVAAIQEQVLGLGALRKLLRLLDRDSCDTALSGSRRLGCCSFSAWMASLCSCGPCSSRCRSSRSSRHSCCRTCWWATPNTKGPCAPWGWFSSWWPSCGQNIALSTSMCLEPCAAW
uniref:Hsp70-binding protein 1 isoform X2 n=1 Tax=Castor canadensis TaxID=51338 RepID=A0A8B7VTB3_CASCN|nr:hsp70-binding protein 1 isoform X2 [Castor canadensis]